MLIQLKKVDAARRLVYGSIDETPDRSGEVLDYASSKPLFEAWSAELFKASGGQSYGNLRSMHQTNVASGKLTGLYFDDAAKRIELVAEVVDDAEWAKVEAGVYTGFSPGGKYAKRWKDGAHTRYTARPTEMSLVDYPAIPNSFELVKVSGETELRKCLGDVGRFAQLLDSLGWLAGDVASEAMAEGDGSALPGRLQSWLAAGAPILADMASEEASEAVARLKSKLPPVAMAQAAQIDDLAKAGARHSKVDAERLQAIHDHAVGMGAACLGNDCDANKLAGGDDDLKKRADAALADLAKIAQQRDGLAKRVAELEALPAPGGPRLMAIDKGAPVGAAPGPDKPASFEEELAKVNAMPAGPERTRALVKLAAHNR